MANLRDAILGESAMICRVHRQTADAGDLTRSAPSQQSAELRQ